MRAGDPIFVEHSNGRLYEVVQVDFYPRTDQGEFVKCHVNHRLQRVEISETVREAERPALLARALGQSPVLPPWQLVPVIGSVA